ncbi:MAG: hypothetical protein WCJ29_02260 [bacterium]
MIMERESKFEQRPPSNKEKISRLKRLSRLLCGLSVGATIGMTAVSLDEGEPEQPSVSMKKTGSNSELRESFESEDAKAKKSTSVEGKVENFVKTAGKLARVAELRATAKKEKVEEPFGIEGSLSSFQKFADLEIPDSNYSADWENDRGVWKMTMKLHGHEFHFNVEQDGSVSVPVFTKMKNGVPEFKERNFSKADFKDYLEESEAVLTMIETRIEKLTDEDAKDGAKELSVSVRENEQEEEM